MRNCCFQYSKNSCIRCDPGHKSRDFKIGVGGCTVQNSGSLRARIPIRLSEFFNVRQPCRRAGIDLLVCRGHAIGAPDSPGAFLRLCHQEERDSVHFSSEMKNANPQDQQGNRNSNTNRRSPQDVLATQRPKAEIVPDVAFDFPHLVKGVCGGRGETTDVL